MNWNPDIGIPIAIIGIILVLATVLMSRPSRTEQRRRDHPLRRPGARAEPVVGRAAAGTESDSDARRDGDPEPEHGRGGDAPIGTAPSAEPTATEGVVPGSDAPDEGGFGRRPGERGTAAFERIVTVLIAARAGRVLHGPDLVVAAEKAGLVFGDRDIFHRLADGRPDQGPVFSVASLVRPGSFDLSRANEIETPGLSVFMTLPGPLPALDAWETMLPTVQRLAELLDAVVLDEQRNALGRQRIAHIRDELRAYDRARESRSRARW